MDEVQVESIVGLGTKVTMKKMIKKDEVSKEEITDVLNQMKQSSFPMNN